MALAIAAMAAKKANDVSVIRDADAASVTYPGFFDDFSALGANFVQA